VNVLARLAMGWLAWLARPGLAKLQAVCVPWISDYYH
jgi:hypothetical protein